MITFTTIEIERLKKDLNTLKNNIQNPRKILNIMSKDLVEYYKNNMESEGIKLNKKRWQKLSPFTVAQKMKLGYGSKRILERTGRLKRGIKKIKSTKNSITIGNLVPYYPQHQAGYEDRYKKIPQRKIIGFNDDVEKIIINVLDKNL